jgi:hypothetical protein
LKPERLIISPIHADENLFATDLQRCVVINRLQNELSLKQAHLTEAESIIVFFGGLILMELMNLG